jgi:hypothetical protein
MTLPSTFAISPTDKAIKKEWTLPQEGEVEIWVEKLRKWISARIIRPLQSEIAIADKGFATSNLDHLTVANAVWPLDSSKAIPVLPGLEYTASQSTGLGLSSTFGTNNNSFGSTNNAFGSNTAFGATPFSNANVGSFGMNTTLNTKPQALPDLLTNTQDTNTRARLRSERSLFRKEWYMMSPPLSVRKHILSRVSALASGSFLAEYTEADTEILMHMFGCFVDERVAGESGFSTESICWRNKRPGNY